MKDPKEKAISLLKSKDRTEFEMREALKRNGFDEIQVEVTLEFLLESGYVDDIKYAENYIYASKEKRRGPNRMRRELEGKGVDSNTIEDALYAGVDYEWEYDTANQIAEDIKVSHSGLGNEKLLAKVVNKLSYEGFSEDIINEIAHGLFDDSDY